MTTLQNITQLILNGNTLQARREIEADKEMGRICLNHTSLTSLVRHDLLEAATESELT